MNEALLAGFISGFLSPLILSWVQHNIVWKTQKKLTIKFDIFTDSISALSKLMTDAYDLELQSNKAEYKGIQRLVELRPETAHLVEHSRGLVKAFFSDAAYEKFDKALRTKVSVETIPDIEFEKNRTETIIEMAKDLGIYK